MKEILLYGFKPFADYTSNITQRIIEGLETGLGVHKYVFDVAFDREMFQRVLRLHRPEVIIGLGQHPRARKLRLERKAKNAWGDPDGPTRPISTTGPEFRYASVALPALEQTTVTYDAGIYVCNYSMYLVGEYCEGRPARFAFIHVPVDYSIPLARRYIDTVLREINPYPTGV